MRVNHILLLMALLWVAQGAHQQWVKVTIENNIDEDQDLVVLLSNFSLKWGHFYDC